MKQKQVKFPMTLAVVAGMLVLGFLIARYGWKLGGFSLCDRTETLVIRRVAVEQGLVSIEGETIESAPAYVGYVHEMEGNTLYIGVKHNTLFGFLKRQGAFHITLQTEPEAVKAIYLRGQGEERLLWTAAEPSGTGIKHSSQ